MTFDCHNQNSIFTFIMFIDYMYRKIVSLILSIFFLVFLVAPTIIVMVDDSVDVSLFYAVSEEEDNCIEKNKDIEVLFTDCHTFLLAFVSNNKVNDIIYYNKKYSKPHLNLISPPPDIIT